MTLGEKINLFDQLSDKFSIVLTFNKLFPEFPLKGYDNNDHVIIGEPITSLTRKVLVNGKEIAHAFDRVYEAPDAEDNNLGGNEWGNLTLADIEDLEIDLWEK